MDPIYDTASSVYSDDFKFRRLWKANETDITERNVWEHDDVYRPYITPPTPFEKTTKDGNLLNPYSQSLWYTFRGNNGEEIEKYRKESCENQQRPVSNKNTEIQTRDSIFSFENDSFCSDLSDFNVDKPNKTTNKLLPSLMEKANISIHPIVKPFANKIDIEKKDEVVSLCGNIDSIENIILKPLNDPPPFKLIAIQSKIVKTLKVLCELSNNFTAFIDSEKILVNENIVSVMFSNTKTLLILHYNFLELLLSTNDRYMDLEQLVYDNIQRLSHVYPSYLRAKDIRYQFTLILLMDPNFKSFIYDFSLNQDICFKKLLLSPAEDFKALLIFLDDYISVSSPRIQALIERLLGEYDGGDDQHALPPENSIELYDGKSFYLKIPSHWKQRYKQQWNKISRLQTEKQIASYLRFEIKQVYILYCRVLKFITLQVKEMSAFCIVNRSILDLFLKYQNLLPLAECEKHKMITVKCTSNFHISEEKIINVHQIIDEFTRDIFISNKHKELQFVVTEILKKTKKLIANPDETKQTDCKWTTHNLFEMNMVYHMLNEVVTMLFGQYVSLLHNYYDILTEKTKTPVNVYTHPKEFVEIRTVGNLGDIVSDFKQSRKIQSTKHFGSETDAESFNRKLIRENAKRDLKIRFFS